jgi:hypothetical protein
VIRTRSIPSYLADPANHLEGDQGAYVGTENAARDFATQGGPGNARLNIDPVGNVSLKGNNAPLLNYGDDYKADVNLRPAAFRDAAVRRGRAGTRGMPRRQDLGVRRHGRVNQYRHRLRRQAVCRTACFAQILSAICP